MRGHAQLASLGVRRLALQGRRQQRLQLPEVGSQQVAADRGRIEQTAQRRTLLEQPIQLFESRPDMRRQQVLLGAKQIAVQRQPARRSRPLGHPQPLLLAGVRRQSARGDVQRRQFAIAQRLDLVAEFARIRGVRRGPLPNSGEFGYVLNVRISPRRQRQCKGRDLRATGIQLQAEQVFAKHGIAGFLGR